MNHIEYKLAGVADAARELLPDTNGVRVERARYERVIDEESGDEYDSLARDDLGIGDLAVLMVDGLGVSGLGIPRVCVPFSVSLLRDMSPCDLGRMLAPEAKHKLDSFIEDEVKTLYGPDVVLQRGGDHVLRHNMGENL